jgi:hypothetical protein
LEAVEQEFQKKHPASSKRLNQNYKKVSGVSEGVEQELQKMHPVSWKHFDCSPKEYTGRHGSLQTGGG